ncbi:MAG: S-layer homology domain-containing protein, partial [Clostridia bacterium]|nr:S-layer homology domain-containing protein [Clostridia bacterium]
TCTEAGEKELTCIECGDVTTEVIPATGHNPGVWTTTKAPTCIAEGTATQYCVTCNEVLDTKVLAVVDHEVLTWVTTTAPGCTTPGVSSYTCVECGDIFDEKAIDPIGHNAIHVDTTPATCTEDGLRDYVCFNCGEEELDVVIKATGHTEGEWVVITPATIDGPGLKVKYCEVCNEIVAEETIEWVVNECDPFTDVSKKAWYHKGVDFVYNSGLMAGISNTKFAPTMATSRGMFVTILGRLSGIDADEYTYAYFEDVKDGSYYFGYIEWARVNGIVAGTGNYVFQPDRAITRQEMCKMIISYADYEGLELVMDKGRTLFKDDASIAKWARNDVYACQRAGIVNGDAAGTFRPTDTASRAEIAVLIMNFWNSCMK